MGKNMVKYCHSNREVYAMFRNLLRPDSPLMITMTQLTDCIFLSLFFLLGCFPVITAGASMAALYDAVWRGFRRGEKHTWQRFAYSFKQNLKPSLLPAVVFLAGGAGLVRGWIWLWNQAVYGGISWTVFAGVSVVLLIPVGMLSLLFPLLSRFETTSARLFGNAVRLSLANLPLTMGLGVLYVRIEV